MTELQTLILRLIGPGLTPALAVMMALPGLLHDAPSTDPTQESMARQLGSVLDDLTLTLQGPPIAVTASPVLCNGGEKRSLNVMDSEAWYFGLDGCELTYRPRQGALVTAASEDLSKDYFAKPETQEHMLSLLGKLEIIVEESQLSQMQKLLVQSVVWEGAFGLERMAELNPSVGSVLVPVECKALEILKKTLFTDQEIESLSSNISELSGVIESPSLRTTISALLREDSKYVEVNRPTEVHASQLLGRFTARIFLGVTRRDSQDEFQRFVTHPSTAYVDLRDLPQRYPGFEAILILYFNVLTEDWKIVPTRLVSGWQQYDLVDKSSFEASLDQAAKNIQFLVVRAVREGDQVRYELVDQDEMARRTFLDVKPTFPNERVTSLRGHCLRCHNYSVATFDTHGRRAVSLIKPFDLRPEQLLGQAYERRQAKLLRWAGSCPDVPAKDLVKGEPEGGLRP